MLSRATIETERFGAQIGKRLPLAKPRARGAHILALAGELGSGKTAFVRGFARGLGITRRITSPTFVLARRYPIPGYKLYAVSRKPIRKNKPTAYSLQPTARYRWFWHFDCYRLRDEHDLAELGFHEIIRDPHAIVLIEWADRVRCAIPKDALWVSFQHHPKGRIIKVG